MNKDKTQEWRAMHGRKASIIYFINRIPEQCPYVQAQAVKELVLHCENMGDRMEMWICQIDDKGREWARYNVKALEHISWLEV